jgi:ADP-ribose pyrophosphatase YjhB (NUDIX family)
VRRVDYFHDPHAPAANTLVPAACAVVPQADGRILLHRRRDNRLWTIPGGAMEIGESIAECVVREVREETGLEVEPQRIVGVYSDPHHVHAFPDGMVRQQFTICFACRLLGGSLAVSDESLELGFFALGEIDRLDMHESIRVRIRDYVRGGQPAIR